MSALPQGKRDIEIVGAKHTAGPWAHSHDGRLPIHIGAKDSRWKHTQGTLIAEIGGNFDVGTGNFQEDLANAKLIAAAPDLLSTLKSVLPILDATRLSTGLGKNQLDRIEKAKAAVAKAEGNA